MTDFTFLTPDFVKSCNACGVPCNLDVFPWKYLGWTDDDFMAEELKFTDGHVIPKDQKKLLRVVRAQEQVLTERWEFVQKRDAVMPKQPKFGKQLELF